jgi:hypothetical protein
MPSPASIEMKSIDLESMVTLSVVNNQEPYVSMNQVVEDDLTHLLATNKDANDIIQLTNTSENIYTNQPSNRTYYSKEIESSLRETFELFTTQGLTDGTFAISTEFVTNQQTLESNTYNIGMNNNPNQYKSISIVEPTNPIYDANIAIAITDNLGEFYTENNDFGVTFNGTESNNNFIRAINSEFSTIDNTKPMTVEELTSFNEFSSSGNDKTQFYTLDSTNTGMITPTFIPQANRTDLNGYNIQRIASENFTLANTGAYRIQQLPDTIDIKIFSNDSINNLVSVQDIPFYNSTISNTDYAINRLPTEPLFINTFKTIFDMTNNIIVPEWKITMDVENTENSGYALSQDMAVRLEPTGMFSLDDSELVDNFFYMKDFVQGDHKITFNDASLRILTQTNGEQLNITNAFSLSTERETLSQSQFNDGEIKLNIHDITSRANIINNTHLSQEQLDIRVYYNNESAELPEISSELKTNSYVKYVSQIVAKKPMNDIGYTHHNNASLNIYNNNQIINDLYSPNNIILNSLTSVPDSTVEVFRINTQQQLSSIGGFKNITTGQEEQYIYASVSLSNLNNISESQNVLSSAKVDCKLKLLSNLSLNTQAFNSGWGLTSVTGNFLSVFSNKAFGETVWPSEAETNDLLGGVLNNLYYKIRVLSPGSSNKQTSLIHKVEISWGSSPTELTNIQEIFNEDLSITYLDNVNNEENDVLVNNTEYDIDNRFTPKLPPSFELYRTTTKNYFKYSFDSLLRPYEGLRLETPELYSLNTFYRIKDTVKNIWLPHSSLKNIKSKNGQPIVNYLECSETIYTASLSNSLSIEGVLTKEDFQDLSVTINAYDDITNNIIPLTNTYTVSSQYGIEVTMELLQRFETINLTGDIKIKIEYITNSIETGDEGVALLNSQDGYSIQLKSYYDSDTNYNNIYSVDYFSSTFANLGNVDKTDIAMNTNKYLTVANGYSNITNWNNSMYKINITYEENNSSTTVLNITKVADNSVAFQIKTPNFKFINSQVFVTRGNQDCYRRIKKIGTDVENCVTTEVFFPVDYTFTDSNGTVNNVFSIDTGVYAVKTGLNYETVKKIGSLLEFNLLQDKISVNMIGDASNTLEPINWVSDINNGLTIQYKSLDTTNMSRKLNLNRYRGFYGQSNVDQVYKIERDQLVATFSVYNSGTQRTASQTFNIYKGSLVTVNNLVDNNGNTVGTGNIGLQIEFNYSMMNTSENKIYNIYTKGDNVTISRINPNVELFGNPISYLTLKDYLLYQYDGANFNNTNGPLRYNSSRLKLNNGTVDVNKVSYTMEVVSAITRIYKISNYLGNPLDNDISDPEYEPTNWGEYIAEADYNTMITDGINTNGLNIKLNSSRSNTTMISYFVQMPPYHKFVMRSANVDSSMNDIIPYDPSINALQNTTTRYLPVNSEGVYRPFINQTYTYIGGQQVTVSINQSLVNNVIIVHHNSRQHHEYSMNPSASIRSFKVEGNNYDIKLFAGLKNTSGSQMASLFNGPANRLLQQTSSTNFNLWLQNARTYNEGVIMNLRQPLNPYNITANRILANSDVYTKENIKLSIESFFITNSYMNKFDLKSGPGQKVTLYTRNISLNENNGTYNVNIYKYNPLSSVDYNGVNLNAQVDTILYNSRYIKTFNISNLSVNQTVIPSWNNLLNSISLQTVQNASWNLDTSFNQLVSVTLANLNIDAMTKIPPLIFASSSSDQRKITVITKRPMMRFLNKFGMPLMEIDSNGNIKSQIISTNAVSLNNVYGTASDNSFTNYSLLSSISYGTGF